MIAKKFKFVNNILMFIIKYFTLFDHIQIQQNISLQGFVFIAIK